jgi:AcrR family transcriptional regulator
MLEAESEEPSLRAVARTAGVSAMAPYRHFPDKTALMTAVADHGFETLRISLTIADDHPDAREALFAQGMAYVTFARTNPALFRLMFSHRFGCAGTEAGRAAYDVLAKRVADMLPDHAMAATLACQSIVHGIAMLELSGKLQRTEHDAAASAVRLFVAGLGAGIP